MVNREALDALVRERVLGRLDHKNLNADIPELAGSVTTTENLATLVRRSAGRGLDAAGSPGAGADFGNRAEYV